MSSRWSRARMLGALWFACLAPATAAAADESALTGFSNAWTSMHGYQTTITITERQAARTETRVVHYEFRKPSTATMHIISGKDAGATLTWTGGPTLVGRKGSGLLAMFSKTFRLHDPTVTTVRGSSIDELSYGAILAHMHEHQAELSESPRRTNEGVSTVAVTLKAHDPAANAELSREEVVFSTSTHLPVHIFGYTGDQLVRKIDFADVSLQP